MGHHLVNRSRILRKSKTYSNCETNACQINVNDDNKMFNLKILRFNFYFNEL